jgi:hypothetical protein
MLRRLPLVQVLPLEMAQLTLQLLEPQMQLQLVGYLNFGLR